MCWLCCCRVSGHGSPAALERPIMESQEECHVQSRTLGSATQLWNHGKNILYMKRILGSEGEIIRGVRGKSQKRRVWGGYDLSHWEGKNRHDMEQQEEYHLNIYIYVCVCIYIYIHTQNETYWRGYVPSFWTEGKQAWNHNGNITYKKDCGGITFLE